MRQCGKCIYRCKLTGGTYCQYILVTGHRRPCRADNCTEYCTGKETKLPMDNLQSYQRVQWEKRNKRKEKQREQNNHNGPADKGAGGKMVAGNECDSDCKNLNSSRSEVEAGRRTGGGLL